MLHPRTILMTLLLIYPQSHYAMNVSTKKDVPEYLIQACDENNVLALEILLQLYGCNLSKSPIISHELLNITLLKPQGESAQLTQREQSDRVKASTTVFKMLVDAGLCLDTPLFGSAKKDTLLNYLIQSEPASPIIETLLQAKANVNIIGSDGNSPLYHATIQAKNNNSILLSLLVKHASPVLNWSIKNNKNSKNPGTTPFDEMRNNKNTCAVYQSWFLKDAHTQNNPDNLNALHRYLATKGTKKIEDVMHLCETFPDLAVNHQNSNGETPLHWAIRSLSYPTIKTKKREVFIQCYEWHDPSIEEFIQKIEGDGCSIIKYFLDQGADPLLEDNNGKNAFHWCQEREPHVFDEKKYPKDKDSWPDQSFYKAILEMLILDTIKKHGDKIDTWPEKKERPSRNFDKTWWQYEVKYYAKHGKRPESCIIS